MPLTILKTTFNVSLEVLDPGIPNKDAGPDFLFAKIKLDSTIWVGHVEVHRRSSDWYLHHHDQDVNYDQVVLHVVGECDREVLTTRGETVPQVVLPVPPQVKARYEELKHTSDYPRCSRVLPQLSPIIVHSWLDALLQERLHDRLQQIQWRLERLQGQWNHCLFVTLARGLGLGLNGEMFEQWALSIPWGAAAKHRDNLFQIEALFFGQAGLLDEQNLIAKERPATVADSYWQALVKEYAYLAHKFNLSSLEGWRWKKLRTRPANFPPVRIAQLAYLYHQGALDLSALMECRDLDLLQKKLQTDTSAYWHTHTMFGHPVRSMTRELGLRVRQLLIINTLIPMIIAYARHRFIDEGYVYSWLEQLPPEDNRMIRLWEQLGVKPQHAGDTQALIQLKKKYCDNRQCLHCRFGYCYMTMNK